MQKIIVVICLITLGLTKPYSQTQGFTSIPLTHSNGNDYTPVEWGVENCQENATAPFIDCDYRVKSDAHGTLMKVKKNGHIEFDDGSLFDGRLLAEGRTFLTKQHSTAGNVTAMSWGTYDCAEQTVGVENPYFNCGWAVQNFGSGGTFRYFNISPSNNLISMEPTSGYRFSLSSGNPVGGDGLVLKLNNETELNPIIQFNRKNQDAEEGETDPGSDFYKTTYFNMKWDGRNFTFESNKSTAQTIIPYVHAGKLETSQLFAPNGIHTDLGSGNYMNLSLHPVIDPNNPTVDLARNGRPVLSLRDFDDGQYDNPVIQFHKGSKFFNYEYTGDYLGLGGNTYTPYGSYFGYAEIFNDKKASNTLNHVPINIGLPSGHVGIDLRTFGSSGNAPMITWSKVGQPENWSMRYYFNESGSDSRFVMGPRDATGLLHEFLSMKRETGVLDVINGIKTGVYYPPTATKFGAAAEEFMAFASHSYSVLAPNPANPSTNITFTSTRPVLSIFDRDDDPSDNPVFQMLKGNPDYDQVAADAAANDNDPNTNYTVPQYDFINFEWNGEVGVFSSSIFAPQVQTSEWKVTTVVEAPDYVFEPDYDLKSLSEVEEFIQENKHLPEIPSAKDMKDNGIEMVDMNMKLLKKIEELTLHTIEQQKLISQLNQRVNDLEINR